eukprot:Clim_evm8s199 gene=Clim_evmTU8s199
MEESGRLAPLELERSLEKDQVSWNRCSGFAQGEFASKKFAKDAATGEFSVYCLVGKVQLPVAYSRVEKGRDSGRTRSKKRKLNNGTVSMYQDCGTDINKGKTCDHPVHLVTHTHIFEMGNLLCHDRLLYLAEQQNAKHSSKVLEAIMSLEKPSVDPWGHGLLAAFSVEGGEGGHVHTYIYFSRLIFELISDPAVHIVMGAIEPITTWTGPLVRSVMGEAFHNPVKSDESPFAMRSILRAAESTGHRSIDENERIPGFRCHACEEKCNTTEGCKSTVLRDYQRQSIRWMIDHENGPGLNEYYWKKCSLANGIPFWYFDLGGEMRLHAPPHAQGGILAEEMGMGKTVEVIVLTLKRITQQTKYARLKNNGGTLIVVPTVLIHQWVMEVEKWAPQLTVFVATIKDMDALKPSDVTKRLDEADIVLTDYTTMSRPSKMGKPEGRIRSRHWFRLVLDECQAVRRHVSQVSARCAKLKAKYRWLVSGTPIMTSVNDIFGHLQFLKVWPYSLQNDGFWDSRIAKPIAKKNFEGLHLLQSLLRTIMMRHSKEQVHVGSDESILTLPSYRIEVKAVPFRGQMSTIYTYYFLECWMQKNALRLLEREYEGEQLWMRAAVSTMRTLANHCSYTTLAAIDRLLRKVMSDIAMLGINTRDEFDPVNSQIPKLNASDILKRLVAPNLSRSGGSNWQATRVFALQTEAELKNIDKYHQMTVQQLRELCAQRELPSLDKKTKQPFIDLLLEADRTAKGFEGAGSTDIHESGFQALMSLMKGVALTCPICMNEVQRPTITLCVHVFCLDCIRSLILRSDSDRPKCPLCRQGVKASQLMEIDARDLGDEDEKVDDVSAGASVMSESIYRSIPLPPGQSAEMDSAYPSLPGPFVAHYKHASASEVGPKIQWLLHDMERYMGINNGDGSSGHKCVIFTNYDATLAHVSKAFSDRYHWELNRDFTMWSPSTKQHKLPVGKVIEIFKRSPMCRALLLSVSASYSGLTLTDAQTLYVLEPCSNKAIESQIFTRLHRIGQRKVVRCVVLYSQRTVEERHITLRNDLRPEEQQVVQQVDFTRGPPTHWPGMSSGADFQGTNSSNTNMMRLLGIIS